MTMKRYNNLASTCVFVLPIASIFYILFIILGYFYIDQFFDFIVMCIAFTSIIILTWITLFDLRDVFIITFYSKEKICQRGLFKKKNIQYSNIKEIYIVGSCIYLSSKNYNLKFREKEKFLARKMKKALKDEIIIMVTSDPKFLNYISFENIKVFKFKNSLDIILKKYLYLD